MPTLIVKWLRETGVLPDQEYSRSNAVINTSLDNSAIKLGYLAEVAFEWDKDGPSMPTDFVHALLFETAGTQEKEATMSVLNELTSEAAI